MQRAGGGALRPGRNYGLPGSLRQLDPAALQMLLLDADRQEPMRSGARELALFLTPEPGAEVGDGAVELQERGLAVGGVRAPSRDPRLRWSILSLSELGGPGIPLSWRVAAGRHPEMRSGLPLLPPPGDARPRRPRLAFPPHPGPPASAGSRDAALRQAGPGGGGPRDRPCPGCSRAVPRSSGAAGCGCAGNPEAVLRCCSSERKHHASVCAFCFKSTK
ncbi:hypothetical protein P7K49_009902 [Saguinus oedipus]|uniref:Uncharacterized protein n=1 Tax=Saguinus oedipus TaxID=9490 RepID=A0ABQ9VL97_SAGOE|nr:hypothetical protein P7K49_009902 [Saguinus oedipus]